MKLSEWLSAKRGRCKDLAAHLDVPPSFVSKMAAGEKPVPVVHGIPIEQFTQHQVTRLELFPRDVVRCVWPELDTSDTPPNRAFHQKEAING